MTGSRPPFDLVGLDHVVLLVNGMERARGFYEQVIGCRVSNALPQYGMVQLATGRSLINLVDIGSDEGAWARPPRPGGRNVDHVAIAIGQCEVDALKAHLAAHGVAIEEEGIRTGARGDSWSVYFRDPDGNLIELSLP